ncbi:MAG: AraC family ligand binding domain-containing protein, partial [Treponema sp.]|nr:AraC family ligand binding domain-containing protein [Treponema sp.]
MEKWPIYRDVSFEALFPFRVLEIAGVGCASASHWHGCMEIVFIEKGALSVFIDGESHEARKDDIVALTPGLIHGFHDPSGDAFIRVFLFGFE